jgi:hypothetical protein
MIADYSIRARRYAETVTTLARCSDRASFNVAYAEVQIAFNAQEQARLVLEEHMALHHRCPKSETQERGASS